MSTVADETLSNFGPDQISRQLPEQARGHLEALRGAIDVRLSALEAALVDPSRSQTLETLILDLARIATTEAQAAAVKACVDTKLQADTETARAVAAVQQRLQQERTAVVELRRSLDEARQQTTRIESELGTALRTAKESLAAEVSRARATTSEADRHIAALRGQLTGAERERDEDRSSNAELRRSLARAEERLADLDQDQAQLRAAHDGLVASLAQAHEAVAGLQRKVDEAHARIETEQHALRESQRAAGRAEDRLAALQHEHGQALTVYQELQSSYEELADRFTRERTAGTDAQRQVAHLTSALDQLRQALDAEHTTTAQLRRVESDLTAQLEALGPEHAEARARHQALTSELHGERSRVESLEASRADLVRQLADVEERRSHLERQLAEERDAAMAAAAAAASVAGADAAQWQARLATLVPERDEARANGERAVAELEGAQQKMARLEQVETDLRRQLETERVEHAGVRRAVEQAEHRLSSVMGNQVQALAHTEELDHTLRDARTEIARLTTRLDAAEGERDAAERRLTEIEARLEKATEDRRPATGPAVLLEVVDQASAAAAAAKSAEQTWGPVRLADRYSFREPLSVPVNTEDGLLCDLSVLGCQIVAVSALKPNQKVKITLPAEPHPLVCNGKVMWARLEPLPKGRGFGCRAGVQFVKPDQDAIDAFLLSRPDINRR